MNLYLLSIGHIAYSVQLAWGLGHQDNVELALATGEGEMYRDDFPAIFNGGFFNHVIVPHYQFPDPRIATLSWWNYRRMVKHRSDIIHVQTGRTFGETFATLWLATKVLGNTPLVATVHDVRVHPGDIVNTRQEWVGREIVELADQVIVHGEELADVMVNNHWFDERKINVVPHGSHDLYLHAEGVAEASEPIPGRVLLFGRMLPYKGIHVLLKAAPIVAEKIPELKIVLAGRGPELDRRRAEIEASPFFEVHEGYIPANQVRTFYTQAAVIAVPYIEASQSGPVNLAFTFGRPLVASDTGAIPETVTHGREGLLVPPGDHEAVARALIEILSDPELAARMGKAARARAEGPLNWATTIADKNRAIYDKALQLRRDGIRYDGIGKKERWKRVKVHWAREAEAARRALND